MELCMLSQNSVLIWFKMQSHNHINKNWQVLAL